MIIQSTSDLRAFLRETIQEVQAGKISNTVARTKLYAAKAFIDTLKVDIAISHLGRTLEPAVFDLETIAVPRNKIGSVS